MKLYRSIGEEELSQLCLGSNIVYGQFNNHRSNDNSSNNKSICCFYVDEVRWKDSKHEFLIVVDIPQEELEFGYGTYLASSKIRKEKIWTGRDGNEFYKIREAYIPSYTLFHVKEIFLFGRYANWYVDERIKPICKKYNIMLHHMNNFNPFENSTQKFIKTKKGYFQTMDMDLDLWVESMKIDEISFVETVKKDVINAELSLEQARKIKCILEHL